MANAIAERVSEVFQSLKKSGEIKSDEAFADVIGVHRVSFIKYRKGDAKIPADVLSKIAETWPNINPIWLLTGEGQMERTEPQQLGTLETMKADIEAIKKHLDL